MMILQTLSLHFTNVCKMLATSSVTSSYFMSSGRNRMQTTRHNMTLTKATVTLNGGDTLMGVRARGLLIFGASDYLFLRYNTEI